MFFRMNGIRYEKYCAHIPKHYSFVQYCPKKMEGSERSIDFYELLEKCKQRHELPDAKTHLSEKYRQHYRKCPSGFEWTDAEFS